MAEPRTLPLDPDRNLAYLQDLRQLVEGDPQLGDESALRRFVGEHQRWFGPRTAEVVLRARYEEQRTMVHVMVLAASELADLHAASRAWLAAEGTPPPPWDVTAPRTAQRLVAFGSRVYGVVEWEPEPGVQLAPDLTPAERRWATALAVGIGERPQWTTEEVWRYAAYLALGTQSFAAGRDLSDTALAARHEVPVEAVRYRRGLPDEPAPEERQ